MLLFSLTSRIISSEKAKHEYLWASGGNYFGPEAGSQDVGHQDLEERVQEVVDLDHREYRGPYSEPEPASELS